jgi:hypothetical protein
MELHEAVGFFMGEEKVKHKRHIDLKKAFPGLITLSLGNILLDDAEQSNNEAWSL